MNRILLLLLVLSRSHLAAIDSWDLGARYYGAGSFDKAKTEFEELERNANTRWDAAVSLYDLGTVSLAAGNWEEAVTNYAALLRETGLPPLLQTKAWTGIALARFREARILKKDDANLKKIVFLLQEAIAAAEEGKKSHCLMDRNMGLNTCSSTIELDSLLKRARVELATIAHEYENYLVQHTPFREGVPLLLASVKNFIRSAELLESYSIDEEIRAKYTTLIASEVSTWLPLWSSLKESLEKELPEFLNSEKRSFLNAKHQFRGALQQLSQFQLKDSILSLKKSADALQSLMLNIFGTAEEPELQKQKRFSSSEILREAIELQTHALDIHRSWQQALIERKGDEEALQLIQKNQKAALKAASRFLNQVLEEQKDGFHALEPTCQQQPWTQSLPYFHDGLTEGKKALMFLNQSPPATIPAMAAQEKSISLWKKTLQQMAEPKKPFQGCYFQGAEEKEDEKPAQKVPEIPIDNVLRELQQMEQLDHFEEEPKPTRKGARPW